MRDDDLKDEAEAAEEARSEDPGEPVGVTERPEVPEADAIEQAQPLVPPAPGDPRIDPETPEADALDQSRQVGDDEETDEHR